MHQDLLPWIVCKSSDGTHRKPNTIIVHKYQVFDQLAVAYPVVVGQYHLDVDDRARVILLENGPLAVRGAIYDRVVVSALLDKRSDGEKERIHRKRTELGATKHLIQMK